MPTLKTGLLLAGLAVGGVFAAGSFVRVEAAVCSCGVDHNGPCPHAPHGVLAPGSEIPSAWHNHNQGGVAEFSLNRGWTPNGGITFSPSGTPVSLTWGFVPDGTNIPPGVGEPASPNNLIAFLDNLYPTPTGPPPQLATAPGEVAAITDPNDQSSKAWFDLFQSSFDRWEELSGVDFNYLAADDGAAFPSSSGSAGVRADIRLGGHRINGNGGTLAYNYFPSLGDMVIDTDDNFFNSMGNNSRRLRNVLMHEIGHGLGMNHVIAGNSRQLMEPTINTSFDGPQLDDIRAIQRLYGDALEKSGGNDTQATATEASSLGLFSAWAIGTDADFTNRNTLIQSDQTDFVSIDNNADSDFFRFTASKSGLFDFRAAPVGPTYNEAEQPPTGQPANPQNPTATSQQSRLGLTVFNALGQQVASIQAGTLGQAIEIPDLAAQAGDEFFVRVDGADNNLQLYRLDAALNPEPESDVRFDLTSAPAQGLGAFSTTESGLELTIESEGSQASLTNSLGGIGVSSSNDGTGSNAAGVDGDQSPPEKLLISFDKTVKLQNLELLGLDVGGVESVELSFESGTNPFDRLNGYAGPYSLGASSLEFSSPEWQSDVINFAFGVDGQNDLLIQAGTVLSLTSLNSIDGGIVLGGLSALAVPEPATWALSVVAVVGIWRRRRPARA